MKILRNKTLLIFRLLATLLVFTAGIFALSNSSLLAFAQGEENDFDGYAIEDIQNILRGQSSFNLGTEYLTIFNEDGSMEDIEVLSTSVNTTNDPNMMQTMVVPSFNVQTLAD